MNGSPGWNPHQWEEGDDVEEVEVEGVKLRILKRVDEPPDSIKCCHMKAGMDECNCEDSPRPDGFNIPILNDKVKQKNR